MARIPVAGAGRTQGRQSFAGGVESWQILASQDRLNTTMSMTTKKKRRWFFRVETIEDANEAMKIAYQSFLALAAIQAAAVLFLSFVGSTSLANLGDSLLMVALAYLIKLRQSRLAAVLLLAYSLLIGFLTASARLGVPLTDLGGRNVILAGLAVYAAYKGTQGTFKYHRLRTAFVSWRNASIVSLVTIVYGILIYAVLFIATIQPSIEPIVWGYGPEAIDESLLGLLILTPLALLLVAIGFRVLPGTRSFPIVMSEPLRSTIQDQ